MATGSDAPGITIRLRKTRIFECVVDVTSYLPGELGDWPANIQDGVYAAMEAALTKYKIKRVDVVSSRCGRDEPTEPWHLVVVLAEHLYGPEAYEVVHGRPKEDTGS
jgi:hypothetical protein